MYIRPLAPDAGAASRARRPPDSVAKPRRAARATPPGWPPKICLCLYIYCPNKPPRSQARAPSPCATFATGHITLSARRAGSLALPDPHPAERRLRPGPVDIPTKLSASRNAPLRAPQHATRSRSPSTRATPRSNRIQRTARVEARPKPRRTSPPATTDLAAHWQRGRLGPTGLFAHRRATRSRSPSTRATPPSNRIQRTARVEAHPKPRRTRAPSRDGRPRPMSKQHGHLVTFNITLYIYLSIYISFDTMLVCELTPTASAYLLGETAHIYSSMGTPEASAHARPLPATADLAAYRSSGDASILATFVYIYLYIY